MNPVIIPVHNCYERTAHCIGSVLEQDIPVEVLLIDNGSTDENVRKLLVDFSELPNFETVFLGRNAGVSKAWNIGLKACFTTAAHALVLNNDIEIPPHFYSSLLRAGEQFITGISVKPESTTYWSCGKQFPYPEDRYKNPHPDFSAFLIHKTCWDKVGMFDEDMVFYAQDCDYHVRMNKCGIWAGSINLPFHHHVSSTLNSVGELERAEIHLQANRDRERFREKYGCAIGSPEYDELFE